jgi:EAL domain-containing protein (putative c-di-GMP-specific phosphodiesterase class I)
MSDAGLIDEIDRALERTGADPSRLVFEITETAAIENVDTARRLAASLRERGCRFALDDFGTGFAGISSLKSLPLDYLKIDREFVRDLCTSETDRHVIAATIDLARAFGLRTIAEGVEDQATLDLLRELGVDLAQGFFLGRPAPIGH